MTEMPKAALHERVVRTAKRDLGADAVVMLAVYGDEVAVVAGLPPEALGPNGAGMQPTVLALLRKVLADLERAARPVLM